jgi:hypothetical protein
MIDLNKNIFDNTLDAMMSFQEQMEKMATSSLEQTPWWSEEWTKGIAEWMTAYNKAYKDFKNIVDESFKSVEEFFTGFEKPETATSEVEEPKTSEAKEPEPEKTEEPTSGQGSAS